MKILIIEGIATSGKSSLIENISKLLGNTKLVVFSETDTHVPIMDNPRDLHVEFFKSLLTDAVKTNAEHVVFDRLHYTQAFRANANISKYVEFEDLLVAHDTLVSYLYVDEAFIANRIKLAAEHRDKDWGEYIKTKGESFDEIARYYIDQQRNQLELLNGSKLNSKIFNTTQRDYNSIATDIIQGWYEQD